MATSMSDLATIAREAAIVGLNDEVVMMKKKIQLSEGQRKAQYEEFENEKKRVAKRIRKVKKDVREISSAKSGNVVDVEVIKRCGKPEKELKEYLNKSPEEVVSLLDLQCIDLQKKLDLISYEYQRKKERIKRCTKKIKELTQEEQTELNITILHPKLKDVTKLENKIHETRLHLLEMRHVEKKYTKMRDSLLEDRVHFERTLDRYEEEIGKQSQEMNHLQSVRDEAVKLREKTKRKLAKLESQVIEQGQEREFQLRELKQRVEEGRVYLEKVERKLVPPNKGMVLLDSTDLGDAEHGAEEQQRDVLMINFAKIKEATGAKNEEDIITKLKCQKATTYRLQRLKISIENEKKQLEMQKEQLEAELEAFKFAQVRDKEQNEEEVEKLEREMKLADKSISEISRSCKQKESLMMNIEEYLRYLCKLMESIGRDVQVSDVEVDSSEIDQLLHLTERKLQKLRNLIEEFEPTENEETLSEESVLDESGLMEEAVGLKKTEGDKEIEKGTEEAPDVPSREFIKRQSQLIVEAQSKKKH